MLKLHSNFNEFQFVRPLIKPNSWSSGYRREWGIRTADSTSDCHCVALGKLCNLSMPQFINSIVDLTMLNHFRAAGKCDISIHCSNSAVLKLNSHRNPSDFPVKIPGKLDYYCCCPKCNFYFHSSLILENDVTVTSVLHRNHI